MITAEKIAAIDLLEIMKNEDVELHQRGNGYQFKCCFHEDRHPSGSVSFHKGKQRWHCFSCNVGGDVVDFIRKRHDLDFKAACQYLGIESGPLSRSQKLKIKKNEQRHKITETFKQWELAAIDELRDTISTAHQISGRWKTIEDFEQGAIWLDLVADLLGQLDVLMTGSKKNRTGIYNRWKQRGGWF